jgi:hypothetical protein
MKTRLIRQAFAAALVLFTTPSLAGPSPASRAWENVRNSKSARPVIAVAADDTKQEPDMDTVAFMSGKCSRLKVAGRDFACKSLVYFHNELGRANFTIVLDDPTDDRNMISFSGENGERQVDNLYELPVDQVLLTSKDRPKVHGLRVPRVELSTGMCRQLGNFAANQVSSITCTATDKNNRKYELQFDGVPETVYRIKRQSLVEAKRRARQAKQLECRRKADVAKILPRDLTEYLLGCLAEVDQKSTAGEPQ